VIEMNPTTNPALLKLLDEIRRDNPRGSEREINEAFRAKVRADPALSTLIHEEIIRHLIGGESIKGLH
jgi:hypothetical protein